MSFRIMRFSRAKMMTALKSTSTLEGTGIEARCAATGMRIDRKSVV